MKKILLLSVLCLSGCGFVDGQLSKGPNGEDSKLEQEVKAVAPLAGPYGTLAISLATVAAGIYGAFHAKKANENTKPDEPPATPVKPTT
jgi:hypothetical protein